VLIDALPKLPADAQCRLARRMLREWLDHASDIRLWSWGASHARAAVRAHEAELRSMVGPNDECGASR
jgi:hypothetical protein